MQYKTFFGNPKELSVAAIEDDLVVGVANAECDGDAIILTFIGVRETHQKRGIGRGLLDRLIEEGRRLSMNRLIAKDVRSAQCLRLLRRKLGECIVWEDLDPAKLTEKPERFVFMPSLGLLFVENQFELTAEWRLTASP